MGGFTTIDTNDIYSVIREAVQENIAQNDEALTKNIYEAADASRDALKSDVGKWSQTEDLPERERLLYEKGWKSYHHKMVDGHVQAVVANATAPGLTHLIEDGHELFVYGRDTGRRTQPRKHIEKAYEVGRSMLLGEG